MEDAVRPNMQAFKAMYERGYCTWFSLYEKTIAERQTHFHWSDYLLQFENAFLNYPSFPENLLVDTSFSNTVVATGISRWGTTQGSCDLPSFDQEFFIQVAADRPTVLDISDSPQSKFMFRGGFSEEDDHVTVLILAWAYILSARWAEIIPGASGPEYSHWEADWDHENVSNENAQSGSPTMNIFVGDIDDDAARWWAAILAMEGGWNASISSDNGVILHSPWHTKLVSKQRFTLSRGTRHGPLAPQPRTASFTTALHYLARYCEFHQVTDHQSHAALAATLFLPVTRYDNTRVYLANPRVSRKVRLIEETIRKTPSWSENPKQLDKLITLSCNAVGTKALLNSVFYEPDVACNICGAWLQGTFSFLNSDIMQDQHILLNVLMKRDPSLGILWLGAFIIGAQTRALQEARRGWWKIDLHVAAWTGTLMSFIQEPVSTLPRIEEISRADEFRLLYLSHEQYYNVAPLFPFPPFGSIALKDTNIEVHQHAQCDTNHRLEYEGLTWRCRGGQHTATTVPRLPLRAKYGQSIDDNISIAYDKLDNEDDDCSEMVTRNVFTWMRDQDGFPPAERAIREHEWIDNLDWDDDDSPIKVTGNAQSVVGGNLHGWLLKTMTKRSNSL